MKNWAIVILLVFTFCRSGGAQGFTNLDFESSIPTNVILLGNGGEAGSAIVPGWVSYENGSPQPIFRYNEQSTDGNAALTGFPNVPSVQGNYFIMLYGAEFFQGTAGIGQTGAIPSTAQSLTFWGDVGANDVTFEGATLSLTVLGSTENYNIYGADVSAFAGQTGQLLFTVTPGSEDAIDNIQFGFSPIPEPSDLALAVFGTMLFGFRLRRRANSQAGGSVCSFRVFRVFRGSKE